MRGGARAAARVRAAAARFDGGRPDAAAPVERRPGRPDFVILGYPVASFAAP